MKTENVLDLRAGQTVYSVFLHSGSVYKIFVQECPKLHKRHLYGEQFAVMCNLQLIAEEGKLIVSGPKDHAHNILTFIDVSPKTRSERFTMSRREALRWAELGYQLCPPKTSQRWL